MRARRTRFRYNDFMAAPDDFNLVDLPLFPPTDETGDVDLWQIQYNLSLTPTQRIEQNDRFAEFVELVREAGRQFYATNH